MPLKRSVTILVCTLAGIALFLSWYLLPQHGLWFNLDKSIFFWFNQQAIAHPTFASLVAITNIRGFDAVSMIAMGLLYLYYWQKKTPQDRCHMLAIGITMLITAVILNQLGHLLPVSHRSPSLFFEQAVRISELTGIATKDSSADSFPGDHGLMLLIFCGFMLRYFSCGAFIISCSIFVIFSLPRVMAGAHWFTDIAVGSLSIAVIGLSWFLLTPLSDWIVKKLVRIMPDKGIFKR